MSKTSCAIIELMGLVIHVALLLDEIGNHFKVRVRGEMLTRAEQLAAGVRFLRHGRSSPAGGDRRAPSVRKNLSFFVSELDLHL